MSRERMPVVDNQGAERAIQELDAHLFSSDTFHDVHNRDAIRTYLERWRDRVAEIAEDVGATR